MARQCLLNDYIYIYIYEHIYMNIYIYHHISGLYSLHHSFDAKIDPSKPVVVTELTLDLGGSDVEKEISRGKLRKFVVLWVPIGSMVLVYMLTWRGYIDGIHVTIYSIHGSYGHDDTFFFISAITCGNFQTGPYLVWFTGQIRAGGDAQGAILIEIGIETWKGGNQIIPARDPKQCGGVGG